MSGLSIPYHELLALFIALSDGSISDADFARLDAVLAGDAKARAFYLEFMRTSAMLEQRAASQGGALLDGLDDGLGLDGFGESGQDAGLLSLKNAEQLLAPPEEAVELVDLTDELKSRRFRELDAARSRSRSRSAAGARRGDTGAVRAVVIPKPLAWLGLAAVLGLIAAAVWVGRPGDRVEVVEGPGAGVESPTPGVRVPSVPGPVQVAVVSDAVGARLADGTAVSRGMRVFAEPLSLAEGVVALELTSGVTLTIEGPAVLVPSSDMYVALERGKLVGRVSDRGQGFTVHANHADIVDLGTEFAVDVAAQETRVQVYDGEVRLASPGTAFASRSMLEGDAGVVAQGQVRQAPFEEFAFLREVPSAYELMVRDLDPLVWWSFSRDDDGRLADRGRAGVHVGDATGWRVTESLLREAFSIDGSQRPIVLSDTHVFNRTNDFTIEAWVRVGFDLMPSSRIVSTMPEDGGRSGFGFGFVGQKFAAEYRCLDSDGRFFRSSPLSVKFSWFGMYDLVTERPIPEGEWVQVVVVCSSEHPVRLYVNGEPQRIGVVHGMAPPDANSGQTPHQVWTGANAGYASAQSPAIGSNPHDGEPEPFVGDLDELVLYDKPLTDEQVLALYEAGLASGDHPGHQRRGR